MNLQERTVEGKTIAGPLDMEAHLGDDGRYYSIDFGRGILYALYVLTPVFPPEYPRKQYGTVSGSNSVLYNLFRPTFVVQHFKKEFGISLLSDALSGWIRNDKEAEVEDL